MLEHKDIFKDIKELLDSKAEDYLIKKTLEDKYLVESTVLVLDSSGFTRISKSHGITYFLSRLVEMRGVIYDAFQKYHCKYFYAMADNVYAEFDTPLSAYSAACKANKAITEYHLNLTKTEIFGICIGIGFGHFFRSKSEGLYGNEMNIASKLGEDIANRGEVLLTKSAYENLDKKYQSNFNKKQLNMAGVQVEYYFTKCI